VALSARLGLDVDATIWIGLGVALFGLTLIRPWWFWDHPKAMFARNLFGDRGTMMVYLSIALAAVVAGALRAAAAVPR
jgi:hypothetical protein